MGAFNRAKRIKSIAGVLFFFLFGVIGVTSAHGEQYTTYFPWETDSVLVAWLIKNHVDENATFSAIAKGGKTTKKFSINTAKSSFRRTARFTAFDTACRIFRINDRCVQKIQPIIRILEMTPWRKQEYPEALRFEQGLVPLFPKQPRVGSLEKAFSYIDRFCNSKKKSVTEQNITDDLAFLGLVENEWKLIVYQRDTEFKSVETSMEPHTFDYDFNNDQVVYVGADKSVRLISGGNEVILLEADLHSFTQPSFMPKEKSIVLVQLINGSSTATNIIRLDPQSKTIQPVAVMARP